MKEALKLALDWYDSGSEVREEFQEMIESILAQPEQEQTGIREIRVTETVKPEQEPVEEEWLEVQRVKVIDDKLWAKVK